VLFAGAHGVFDVLFDLLKDGHGWISAIHYK
jgi:hypothetical protein